MFGNSFPRYDTGGDYAIHVRETQTSIAIWPWAVNYAFELLQLLFTRFLLPERLRQCKHRMVQTTVRQHRGDLKFMRNSFLTNVNARKSQFFSGFD
jgi:hypothetical protein